MAENETYPLMQSATLPSGATNGDKQDSTGYRGLILVVDVTAATGTSPTLTVKLQEYLPQANAGAGRWVDIAGATTAAIDAESAGATSLVVYPGCIAATNTVVNRPIGEHFRYVATVGGTSTPTVTCSIHAQMVL
jgi:hypothetical protein